MNKGDNRMSIIELLKIEFMKVKRSMILPLLLIPPILVVVSGVYSKCIAFWLLFTSVFNGSCMRYDC